MVMRSLEAYCNVSGQQVNLQKSYFLMDRRLNETRKRIISQVMSFKEQPFPIKYLGCSLYVGRGKLTYFSGITESVSKWVFTWNSKLLSYGGKLSLIKSVLVSIPIHLLVLATPMKGFLRNLEKILGAFLWGSSDYSFWFH